MKFVMNQKSGTLKKFDLMMVFHAKLSKVIQRNMNIKTISKNVNVRMVLWGESRGFPKEF